MAFCCDINGSNIFIFISIGVAVWNCCFVSSCLGGLFLEGIIWLNYG